MQTLGGHRRLALGVGISLLSLMSQAALAGVVDSPVPNLNGSPAKHVFTVPGIIKNNNLETIFLCSSLDQSSLTVAVEVFASTGGNPLNNVTVGDGVEGLAPGATVTIATGATVAFHEDDVLPLAAASLRNGSARIISTSKRIGCEAFIVDELGDTPVTMAPLKVLYKTKQRGE